MAAWISFFCARCGFWRLLCKCPAGFMEMNPEIDKTIKKLPFACETCTHSLKCFMFRTCPLKN